MNKTEIETKEEKIERLKNDFLFLEDLDPEEDPDLYEMELEKARKELQNCGINV